MNRIATYFAYLVRHYLDRTYALWMQSYHVRYDPVSAVSSLLYEQF